MRFKTVHACMHNTNTHTHTHTHTYVHVRTQMHAHRDDYDSESSEADDEGKPLTQDELRTRAIKGVSSLSVDTQSG